MAEPRFPGSLAIQQRVLAAYRAPFFAALAQACEGGLNVCAGLPRPEESIAVDCKLRVAKYTYTPNLHFLRGPYYLCYQRGLRAWLEGCNPDALIVEANPRYLATPSSVRWMKKRGRPVLGWGLGAPQLSGTLSGLRKSRRISFLGRFDALITYSQQGAEGYAAMGFPMDRIFVAPNAAAARPSQSMRPHPEAAGGKPGVLFVGRLQARKRLDLLLRACEALPETLQPRLVIVGDGPERAALETQARQIYPQAEFPGAKYGQELGAFFDEAQLFVLPGTGGLAVQEAMAHGLPVIMGQGDGTNDNLVRSGNGWQIPPNDLAALTQTLKMALMDQARLQEMGAESYRIVTEEVNLEKMVEVFVKALNYAK